MKHNRKIDKKQVGFIFVCILWILCGCSEKKETILSLNEAEADVSIEEPINDPSEEVLPISKIFIDVEGCVEKPGVYQLDEGARVFQALEAAGGLTESACLENLNQARSLEDGEKLKIYSIEEWEELREKPELLEIEPMEDKEEKVNLNTADMEKLMTITGIGQTRAEAILSYREQNGGFQTIEEIMEVEGIKEGTFTKIKDKIDVE